MLRPQLPWPVRQRCARAGERTPPVPNRPTTPAPARSPLGAAARVTAPPHACNDIPEGVAERPPRACRPRRCAVRFAGRLRPTRPNGASTASRCTEAGGPYLRRRPAGPGRTCSFASPRPN